MLQERDRRLLAQLPDLKVIDRDLAMLLCPFGSAARANARLLQLYRARVLDRIFVGSIGSGKKAVYFLRGTRPTLARRFNLATRESAIAHQIILNRLYHGFTAGPDALMLRWRFLSQPLSPEVPIIPDAAVSLLDAGERHLCLLELDRGTESQKVIAEKAQRYLLLAQHPDLKAVLGSRRFRVLVVTTARRRIPNLQKTLRSVTTKVFWIAHLDDVLDQGPLASNWWRPANSAPVPLFHHICDTADPATTCLKAHLASASAADEATTSASAPDSTPTDAAPRFVPPADQET